MSLNETPRANRLHIGIYGKRNVGKSCLVNAITGQSIAVVSDVPGTTTLTVVEYVSPNHCTPSWSIRQAKV